MELARARLWVRSLSFASLAPRLGVADLETAAASPSGREPALRSVAWATAAAARRVPWRAQCLEQAIAAQRMLRRRGLASTLYFGIARDAERELAPHAWLRSGSVCVTGGPHVEHYAVVARYGDEP